MSTLFAVYLAVWSLLGLAFLVVVIWIALKVRAMVANTRRRVEQLTSKIESAIDPATTAVRDISERAQRIGELTETTARRVADRVDASSESLADPVVNLASFFYGVRKGLARAGRKTREDERERPE